MPVPSHILLVEDDTAVAGLLLQWLVQDWPPTTMVQHVTTLAAALAALPDADMLLVDLSLPDTQALTGIEVIDALVHAQVADAPPLPMVILTGQDKEGALLAIRHGAGDWVSKDDATLRMRLKDIMEREWARYRFRCDILRGIQAAAQRQDGRHA